MAEASAQEIMLINVEEPTRKTIRKRRKELQDSFLEQLGQLVWCAPPDDAQVEEFQKVLDNPDWVELTQLVNQMKMWDIETTIPEPKTFLYYAHLQPALADMLADINKHERYLRPFIERFDAENELVPLKQWTTENGSDGQRTKRLHDSGKDDAPIHFAVMQLHEGLLEWLLGRPGIDVNLRNNHKETALAILCEKYDERLKRKAPANVPDHESELALIRALIERLLAAGADFNICSMKLKLPIELLLRHGAGVESRAFVKRCVQQAGCALVVVKTEGNTRLVGFLNNDQNVRLTEELFEIFLRYMDIAKFREFWPRFTVTEANVKKVIRLLLHTTLDQRLPECVRLVVNKGDRLMFRLVHHPQPRTRTRNALRPALATQTGADQRSSEMEHRVELKGLLRKACEMADLCVLQLLVRKITDLILLNDDPLLALTLTKAHKMRRRSEERSALLACAEFLAVTQTIHMSKADDSGNTPLHLALKYGFETVALSLLDQRYAYLGLRNRDNLTPLDYGTYEFWKSFLDRCIVVESDRGSNRHVVRFNLNCFEPFAHGRMAPSTFSRGRTASWRFVQDATSFKHQPRRFERTVTEMTTVRQIAQSKELKSLLIHPVVHTFIMVKWMRLSHWNYLNLLLTALTAVLFAGFSLTVCSRDGPNVPLRVLSAIGTVLLGSRELLQALFLRKSYLSLENTLDLANVAAMGAVVWASSCHGLLSSLVVVSLAMQITFLLGSLPFNSLSTVMYMFKTVSQNFLRSFLLFIPLIGAFVYAFYLTHGASPDAVAARDACNDDDCAERQFNSFHTFWNATIKTLVMTTGELEAASFDFTDGRLWLFVLFLFVAPIVIMNLINGLAVSDIAAIRDESELISIGKKVMLLEQYERGVANVRPAWLRPFAPRPFFAEHNHWIQVRAKEFRKIEVHRRDETPGGNGRRQEPSRFAPISVFPWVGESCANLLLNFRLFKISLFMRLDDSILHEALAIHEKRHPFAQSGTPAGLTVPVPRTPSPPITPNQQRLQNELQELKTKVATLLELMRDKPKRSKQLACERILKKMGRKRGRQKQKRTLIDDHTEHQ